jgi:glycosyltransferase involved in cell wall biosynthesis
MQRIALCIMVGDGTSHDDWNRLIASVEDNVDSIYVGYTEDDASKFPFRTTDNMVVQAIGWDQDFGRARNENLAMVDRSKYDWIMWLDSDDELVNGDKLKDLLQKANPRVGLVFMKYWYAFNHETDEVVVEQYRERIWRAHIPMRWDYMIHEVAHFPPGTAMAKPETDVIVKHWRDLLSEDNQKARRRNRELLAEAQRRDPDEPRYHIYLAHEVFAEYQAQKNDGKLTAAAVLRDTRRLYETYLRKYSDIEGDDPYMANCRLADCLREQQLWNEAVDRDLQGIKMRPNFPEAYVGIALSFLSTGQNELAIEWSNKALQCGPRENFLSAHEVQGNAYAPYFVIANSYERMQDWEKAAEAYQACMDISPHLNDYAGKIAEMRANAEVQKVADEERKKVFGKDMGKSICFVTKPLFEPWHPDLIDKDGSGGTEACVIEVAKRFARDGWRVAIFGSPGALRGQTRDGVEYWDTARDYDVSEPFTITVSVRAPDIFDANLNSKKTILWMHDVSVGDVQVGPWGDRFQRFDLMLGVSEWHANHLKKVYDVDPRKVSYIYNGFNKDMFSSGASEKKPFSMAYASSPDRGLENLLEIWPVVKKHYPEATLDVFYGWHSIDKILSTRPNHPLRFLKQRIEALFLEVNEDNSITWHDRVSRAELAKHYASTSVWAYPTAFCETFCITALEMQAAGVIPVTTQLAALNETVACKELLIPGHAGNADYRKRFMQNLQMVFESEDHVRDYWIAEGRAHVESFAWDTVFESWRQVAAKLTSDRVLTLV